ncbi:hypothetical protein NDA18_003455 [Ustilago nuda]|nr:hypothetical protein NDA18_003455 [Ustilago nuda]
MLIPSVPDETPQQKAERQARLSQAMGVMFLQDKVQKLERDVSKITYPRSIRQTKSGPAADLNSTNNRNHAAKQQGRPKPRAETSPAFANSTDASTETNQHPTATAKTIRLVDASLLIFSLRSVHNWSRDRSTCVIIPLEAINTLDLLKKGDEPINLAARKATRWLEEKIAVSTHEGDAMLTQPASGIFAQKDFFRATYAQIDKARCVTRASTDSNQIVTHTVTQSQRKSAELDPGRAARKDMFCASQAPRYVRELLSVCLYCHQTALPTSDFAVAIAYPPAHLQDKMLEAQSTANDKPSYLVRTDGRATEAWLDAYGIPFQVAPTSKTWMGEKQSSRFRSNITSIPHLGSCQDLAGSKQEASAQQKRIGGSPTPSLSSSTGSFKSELSRLSILGSHKSPRHRQDQPFTNTATRLGSMQSVSPGADGSASATDFAFTINSSYDAEDEIDGPIIARPSSAASSHASLVSSLTTSTQDDWSSETSASRSSHCGTRITRHPPSTDVLHAFTDGYCMSKCETVPTPASSSSLSAPRSISGTLHKTRSGANKMEEYLRRLEAGAATSSASEAGLHRPTATSTSIPTTISGGGSRHG